MKMLIAAAAFLAAGMSTAEAAQHRCAADAIKHAGELLTLHFNDGVEGPIENMGIDDDVTTLAPLKALKGNGKFDVLEVWGYIYKGEYRMRFIYAQIEDECVLMGQEILESADPY